MKEKIRAKAQEAQEKIAEITELIYQKKEKKSYPKIDELIAVLMELEGLLMESSRQGEKLPFEIEEFKQILMEAMEAMEQKDMVLFADILQDGLCEMLES